MVRVSFADAGRCTGEYPNAVLSNTVFNRKTGMVELRDDKMHVVAFVPFSQIMAIDSKNK